MDIQALGTLCKNEILAFTILCPVFVTVLQPPAKYHRKGGNLGDPALKVSYLSEDYCGSVSCGTGDRDSQRILISA